MRDYAGLCGTSVLRVAWGRENVNADETVMPGAKFQAPTSKLQRTSKLASSNWKIWHPVGLRHIFSILWRECNREGWTKAVQSFGISDLRFAIFDLGRDRDVRDGKDFNRVACCGRR